MSDLYGDRQNISKNLTPRAELRMQAVEMSTMYTFVSSNRNQLNAPRITQAIDWSKLR